MSIRILTQKQTEDNIKEKEQIENKMQVLWLIWLFCFFFHFTQSVIQLLFEKEAYFAEKYV